MLKRKPIAVIDNGTSQPYYKYPHIPRNIDTEEHLAWAVQSRLKRSSATYDQWRCYVAFSEIPNTKDLDTDFLAFAWSKNTFILCCWSFNTVRRWLSNNPDIKATVRTMHRNNTQKLDVRNVKGQYMQYSKHVLENRVADKDSPRYDPLLDYTQQFLKKWDVKL